MKNPQTLKEKIASDLRERYGVEDIGRRLRKRKYAVKDNDVRRIVDHWRKSGHLMGVLGLKPKETGQYAYQVAMERTQDE